MHEDKNDMGDMSHPAWDAWIEIVSLGQQFSRLVCRIPHGMRGLKFCLLVIGTSDTPSHPAWDAWIEIIRKTTTASSRIVASRMGCVD